MAPYRVCRLSLKLKSANEFAASGHYSANKRESDGLARRSRIVVTTSTRTYSHARVHLAASLPCSETCRVKQCNVT